MEFSEEKRFKDLNRLFDKLNSLIENIENQYLKIEISETLNQIELLSLLTPDMEYSRPLRTVNLVFFGNERCGKREILERFLPDFIFPYVKGSAFRFKQAITLADQSVHLLIIRDDGYAEPTNGISKWAHCGIFCFDMSNEESYLDSIKNQKSFHDLRKGKKRAPTILVGLIRMNDEQYRQHPYIYYLESSKSNDFQLYIELHFDSKKNVDYLFQCSTALTLKYLENETFSYLPFSETIGDAPLTNTNNLLKKRKTIGSDEFVVPNKKLSIIKTKLFPFTNKSSNSLSPSNSLNSNFSMKSSRMSLSSYADENLVPITRNNEEIMKQGILIKDKDFVRNTVFVTIYKDGVMFYHKSQKHFQDGKTPIYLDLLKFCTKVRQSNNKRMTIINPKEFEMIGMPSNDEKTIKIIFKAENMIERDRWVDAVRFATEVLYKKLENKDQCNNEQIKLKQLQKLPFNDVCAECNSPDPEWISCNLGIFICTRCSGGHRKLGSNISKVSSSTLDTMSSLQVMILEKLGNLITNSVFEETLNHTNHKKPLPNNVDDVYEWLKMKYVEKRFIAPLPFKDDSFSSQFIFFLLNEDYRNQLLCIHNSTIDEMNKLIKDDDRTPFLAASQYGYIVTIQLLAWAGVNVNATNQYGLNAYAHALYQKPKNPSSVLNILQKIGVCKQKIEKNL